MGKPVTNEVILRQRAKEVRALIIEQYEIEKAIELIKQNEEILVYNFGKSKYLSLLPTIRLEKGLKNKYDCIKLIVKVAVEIYLKNGNYEELAFFAAASCDIDNLRLSLNAISREDRNKTREGDSIALFFVKYASLENPSYIDTLKILVYEYKLSVNQPDYTDHSPIIILLNKYDSLQQKGVTDFNRTILNAASIILSRENVDLTSNKINGRNALDIIKLYSLDKILDTLRSNNQNTSRNKSELHDDSTVLFILLAQKIEKEFLEVAKQLKDEIGNFDIDDGNNTLLQLSCEKNLKTVVTYLIKQGATLEKTTKRNRKTPLEIAARRNFHDIFIEILKANQLTINSEVFSIFVLNRGRQIKTKYFDELLCYDGLQVDISYNNGNTPLHYALIFSNTEAILKLIKRGASLLAKNNNGKTPLDLISKEELELYFDHCILPDRHNHIYNKKFEIRFDYNGLLQSDPTEKHANSEVEIASRICSSDRLKSLATHPLLVSFMEVKWSMVSPLYNNILAVYGFLFLYYSVLAMSIGHMTFLFLLTLLVLIYFTLQPSINLKHKQSYATISLYVLFTVLTYYFIGNKHISICIVAIALLYKFSLQHLYFSKYQAKAVNIIRKLTLHSVLLFAFYSLSDIDSTFHCSKISFPIIIYTLIVTYSFNVLVDSVANIEDSFKSLYNIHALEFIRFAEKLYYKFDNILNNPFIKDNFPSRITSGKEDRCYLHYNLNKNKFNEEKFHFLKLDVTTVKRLQHFLTKASNSNKN